MRKWESRILAFESHDFLGSHWIRISENFRYDQKRILHASFKFQLPHRSRSSRKRVRKSAKWQCFAVFGIGFVRVRTRLIETMFLKVGSSDRS